VRIACLSPSRLKFLLGFALVSPIAAAHAEPIGIHKIGVSDHNWIVDGAVDIRYRNAAPGSRDQIYTQTVELDVQHPITYRGQRKGNVYIQGLLETPQDQGSSSKSFLRVGEAYISYQLPILTQTDSLSYIKAGQFPVALGLTPVYDTHLQIMQSLYPESLGERLDWGLGVDGRFYGVLDYKATMTAGLGPDKITTPKSPVVAFRLGRLFATPAGAFNIGGSILSGRMPQTAVDPVTGYSPALPPSGYTTAPYGFVNKTRIAGDGQWTYQQVTLRAEAVAGADADKRVFGYFVQGEYRFAPGFTAIAARKSWDYGVGTSKTEDNAVGLNISYGNNLAIRTLAEERHDVPVSATTVGKSVGHFRHIFTIQLLGRF
jgi:hypothetical protein